MIQISSQLRNPEFRFIKLKKNDKIPIEKDWQNTKNYRYDDAELLSHEGNIGIIGGYGDLRILDIDSPIKAQELIKNLPQTFSTITGNKGYHFYFISDYDVNHVLNDGIGELRSKNYQVVIAGSTHPNGNKYQIAIDKPIQNISKENLFEIIKPYLKESIINDNLIDNNSNKDTSRSAKEYREVIKLISSGKSKDEIFEEMKAFSKWSNAPEQYRELTYSKAFKYYQLNKKTEVDYDNIPEHIIKILKNKDLLNLILIELDKKIVKEEETKLTILLICLGGKLTENAEPTSTNLMVNDSAGAGKDFVVRNILELLPSNDIIKRKRISEKVFTYWHNAKFEPDWSWNNKVFYNEDISNAVLNSDVFKVMSSSDGKNESTIIINQIPVEIITNGKPVMIITIASASPNNELLRRFPICNLDTSEEQTKLILKRKATFHERGIKPQYDENIKLSLTYLKRIKVKVPYASKLVNLLSSKNIIIRTHFDRFIDYIKFSCALHQYQREKDNEEYYLATKEDYDFARICLMKTTSNVFSITLTKNQQKIIEVFNSLPEKSYSISELEPKIIFISDRFLRIEIERLVELGFLSKEIEKRENSDKPVKVYTLLKFSKINIPKWYDIENNSIPSLSSFTSFASNPSNPNRAIEVNEAIEAHPSHQKVNNFDEIAKELLSSQPLSLNVLIERCLEAGLTKDETIVFIEKGKSEGTISEPTAGYLVKA